MNNTQMKKRIEYLDVAKGIGILLMVAGHIYESNWFQVAVYAFHMPLFLFISGKLLCNSKVDEKSIKKFLISRFKSLMVPYIVTEILVLPLFYLKNGCTPADLRWIITDSVGLYYTRGAATWFLLNLFIAETVFFLFLKVLRSKKILAAVCVMLYILSACGYSGNHIIEIILRSLNGMFFLAIGYFTAQWKIKLMMPKVGNILIMILFVTATTLNGKVEMMSACYGSLLLYTVTSLTGSYLVVLLSKRLSDWVSFGVVKRFLQYWGRNTLFVVCAHLIIMRYGIDWFFCIGPRYTVLIGTIVFIFVIFCEYILITACAKVSVLKSHLLHRTHQLMNS